MKRDMDLIRELLLKLEAMELTDGRTRSFNPNTPEIQVEAHTVDEINAHLRMLYDAGYVDPGTSDGLMRNLSAQWYFRSITWTARDFLDSVREPKVWSGTMEVAKKAGGWTIGLLAETAKALVKGELRKLGVPMS